VALAKAMGPIRVFAVGIDDYDETSAYPTLKTCSNDAHAIIDCFRDVHQLNADKGSLSLCTSRTSPKLRPGTAEPSGRSPPTRYPFADSVRANSLGTVPMARLHHS
jgi:hypothetical protein